MLSGISVVLMTVVDDILLDLVGDTVELVSYISVLVDVSWAVLELVLDELVESSVVAHVEVERISVIV